MRLVIVFLLIGFVAYGQKKQPTKQPVKKQPVEQPPPVDGFWLVTKVTVGTKELTPIARWFKIEKGKHTSGNGWLQHSFGTYKFDKKNSELVFVTNNEPEDEFGAFKVERKGPLMTWNRKEEGEMVVVELKPITELPKSPSDDVKGLWVLEAAIDRELDVTKSYDPDHKQFLFIRWDHKYDRQINAYERISGYWFCDAHRPEITLISEDRVQQDEQWSIVIEGPKLTLKGASDNVKTMVLVYKRATDFPK